MFESISPVHRTWLLRGALAISALAVVATGLATRTPAPAGTVVTGESPNTNIAVSTSQIAELARRSTVQVVATDRRGESIGQGSGFFLSPDGLIATNYHVIAGASRLSVATLDGDSLSDVLLVAVDTVRDLAVLRVRRKSGSFLPISQSNDAVVGAPVFVMGNPLGQVGTFSTGVVSATRSFRDGNLIQITAPISPGSSGGPVLNGAGEVIGVATLQLRGGENINYAVSAQHLMTMVAEMDNGTLAAESSMNQGGDVARTAAVAHDSSEDILAPEISFQFRGADSILATAKYVPETRIVRGYLEDGDYNQHPLALKRAGRYAVVAFCDYDCSLMGLTLREADGQVIARDEGSTDSPALGFGIDSSAEYSLHLSMLACAVSPCQYGLRLYRLSSP